MLTLLLNGGSCSAPILLPPGHSPSTMHSLVTEKGEQGAMPTRSIEYLQASGWRVAGELRVREQQVAED